MFKVVFFALVVFVAASAQAKTFSEEAWARARPTYDAILKHPFITGLASGKLAEDKFIFYLEQDARYLNCFAKALLVVAEGSSAEDATFFKKEAESSIQAEKGVQDDFLKRYGRKISVGMAPTNTAYCNHLIANVTLGNRGAKVAALLPCYWVYMEVGKHLKKVAVTPNPYQRWIAMYASPGYEDSVRRVIAIADKLAKEVSASEREEMLSAFERSVVYEWNFWDAAYNLEKWKP